MTALAGLKVVELGRGPISGLATAILADFGADVLWLDPGLTLERYAVWQRGKRRIAVDLAHDADRVRELVATRADAFVTSLGQAELGRFDLTPAALASRRSDLVIAHLTAMGSEGPYRDWPEDEALAAALIGRMQTFEGVAPRPGPVFPVVPVGTHTAAQGAAAAVLAALVRRARTGAGCTIETDLLRGLLPYEMNGLLVEQLVRRGELDPPRFDPHTAMPSINYHPVLAGDGRWLQLGNLLPHLLQAFLDTAGLDAITRDPEFGGRWSAETTEKYRELMLARLEERDAADWMADFVRNGSVVAHPYQTTREALADPDITANGHAIDVHGRVQLGVVARLTATPGTVGAPPRETGWDAIAWPVVSIAATRDERVPLAGVTVVECATIIAAPLGAALLADLGARVIKIEPPGGDPFRGMGGGHGADRCNTGKESVCLDLKDALAREAVQRIAAGADILIHNYRPGVPERLGLGFDELSARNPGLVHVTVNGYGALGPGARRPSTHPIPGAALGGVVDQMGATFDLDEPVRETARRLLRANELNPDPNTSAVVATAAMLGLAARAFHGGGQAVFVDMFGANAWANFDVFFADAAPRPSLGTDLCGTAPERRLYPCADGWVFVAAPSVAELGRAVGARPGEVAGRLAGIGVEAALALLATANVPAARADAGLPAVRLLDDPFFMEHGYVQPVDHPRWGRVLRHGSVVKAGAGAARAPCAAGDSTRAVLGELGFSAREIAQLAGTAHSSHQE